MFVRWVVVALLGVSLATPRAVLQPVAWISMVIEYSRQATVAHAVSMTFDGRHPCKLCKLIQDNPAEKKSDLPKLAGALEKFELGLPPQPFLFVHPPVPGCVAPPGALKGAPAEPPPLPPPRLA